jgi:hypothetical protein
MWKHARKLAKHTIKARCARHGIIYYCYYSLIYVFIFKFFLLPAESQAVC